MGKERITYRDFKNFNDIEFICDIQSIDWSYAPKTTMQTWVLRSSCLFNKCLDKNAPLKTVSKIGEKVLQNAKTYHFAHDTSAILSSTSLQILSKRINKDV